VQQERIDLRGCTGERESAMTNDKKKKKALEMEVKNG